MICFPWRHCFCTLIVNIYPRILLYLMIVDVILVIVVAVSICVTFLNIFFQWYHCTCKYYSSAWVSSITLERGFLPSWYKNEVTRVFLDLWQLHSTNYHSLLCVSLQTHQPHTLSTEIFLWNLWILLMYENIPIVSYRYLWVALCSCKIIFWGHYLMALRAVVSLDKFNSCTEVPNV